MSEVVRFSYPVYLIISQPYRLSEGYGGYKFANLILEDYDDCLAVFHHEVEAEEFVDECRLDNAKVVEIIDESELKGTCKHARRLCKFERIGWLDPKSEGGVCTHPIQW